MTKIEWADEVWNPVTGCRKVSAGCAHCYAETWAKRGMGQWKGRAFEDVRVHEDRLDAPLRWRKPRRVFVNSMSDLFHEDVPDEFIFAVLAVINASPLDTFLVLTKRPGRARALLHWIAEQGGIGTYVRSDAGRAALRRYFNVTARLDGPFRDPRRDPWMLVFNAAAVCFGNAPLPNVHLGVSCEDQRAADERIPLLLDTPAAVRWVSAEPLLGPIDFLQVPFRSRALNAYDGSALVIGAEGGADFSWTLRQMLHWLVVGGESGPGARPCDVAWIRDIVNQCGDAGVPAFVKQLGARPFDGEDPDPDPNGADEPRWWRLRDRKGGDPSEWPEDLRVREFPR